METESIIEAIHRLNDFMSVNEGLSKAETDSAMTILHESIGMTDEVFEVIATLVLDSEFFKHMRRDLVFAFISYGVALGLMAVQYEHDQGKTPTA